MNNSNTSPTDSGMVLSQRATQLLRNAGFGPGIRGRLRTGFQQIQIQDGIDQLTPPGLSIISSPTQITGPVTGDTGFFIGGGNTYNYNIGGGGGIPGPPGAAGPPGATGATGPPGANGAPGSGAFWEDGEGTVLSGDGSSAPTAYSVSIDSTVDSTVDISSFITGASIAIVGDNLVFTFERKKLVISYNDGGAVVAVDSSDLTDLQISIPLEEQSCPDPC